MKAEQCKIIYDEIQKHMGAILELEEQLENIDLDELDAEEDEEWNSSSVDDLIHHIDEAYFGMYG